MTGDCGGTLPVQMQLSGKKTANGNQLTWNMDAQETGATYTVERRLPAGSSFRTLATGGYIQSGSNKYTYVDQNPAEGTNMYRIKKTMTSGAVEYSNTMVIASSIAGITVFPNPVRESFTLEIHNETATNYTISLYTMDGQLIFQKPLYVAKEATVTYPTPVGLKAGTYILRIANLVTGVIESKKLLVNGN